MLVPIRIWAPKWRTETNKKPICYLVLLHKREFTPRETHSKISRKKSQDRVLQPARYRMSRQTCATEEIKGDPTPHALAKRSEYSLPVSKPRKSTP